MSKTWRILSIDGGGIRGLIPATILAEIERRTGKPIYELFDLIAGTSTGAILALGLTKPDQTGHVEHSARMLRDIYERDAPNIFKHPANWWENLLKPKYKSFRMRRTMSNNFGRFRLKDALTDILIPCYDIEHRSPHIFRSRWAKRQGQYDFLMADVASAASATPTMFEPVQIARPGAGGRISLVDGGVFANNPAGLALAEINTRMPEKNDQYLLVSLGTGESMERMRRKYPSDWGYVRWSVPMVELVSESISESVHRQVKDLLPPIGSKRYYRFQVDLPDDTYYPLDNVAKQNVRGLIESAEALLTDNRTIQDLSTLCDLLLSLCKEHKTSSKLDTADSARSNNKKRNLPSSGYTVTLCHAEEDNQEMASPLAHALRQKNLNTRLLALGKEEESIDSLVSMSAEDTLITIILFSPALLKNAKATEQLSWLFSRTLSGENVIIPVIHRLQNQDISDLVHHMQWHESPKEYLQYLFNLSISSANLNIEALSDKLFEEVLCWLR